MPVPHKFAVVVPVGSNPKELDRLADTLDSLFHYEPRVSNIVLVDDTPALRHIENRFRVPDGCRIVSVLNPRLGRGNGWLGGLAAGMSAAFHWIATNAECDFVLKIDTDSLVINPFSERISNQFQARPDISLLGTYSQTPNRPLNLPEDFSTAPALQKLRRPFTVWRRTCYPWPRLQCSLFPEDRLRRQWINAAVENGYELGRHCQGGGYAIRGELLKTLLEKKAFDHPLLWLWTPCGEDVAVTVIAYAHGGRALDFNGRNEPFGVTSRGLADTPEAMVERGFSVIHSIKDCDGRREEDIRTFFKQRRIEETPGNLLKS
jgi:hypothetical protein